MQIKIITKHHFLHTFLSYSNKKETITSVDENMEKLEPSYTAAGVKNGAATLGNSLAVLQIVKHRVAV